MRLLPMILLVGLVTGCYWHKKPAQPAPVAHFIPGTYVTYEEGNFCAAWDTLIIAAARSQQNLYTVSRRSAFQRNLGEDVFPLERAQSKWKGIYDATSKVLQAIGQQPDLTFDPEQNLCTLYGVIYRRVE
jgi:hypothetical protein